MPLDRDAYYQSLQPQPKVSSMKLFFSIVGGICALIVLTLLWGFWFLTPEGHVSVVTRFGKAATENQV